MSLDKFPVYGDKSEIVEKHVRLLGTGAAAPTKVFGDCTVTRTSIGLYKLTWADNNGQYMGFTVGLEAATPADIAGHSLIADTYSAASGVYSQEYLFSTAAEAAHDLAANEYINLVVRFARNSF